MNLFFSVGGVEHSRPAARGHRADVQPIVYPMVFTMTSLARESSASVIDQFKCFQIPLYERLYSARSGDHSRLASLTVKRVEVQSLVEARVDPSPYLTISRSQDGMPCIVIAL